MAHNPLDTINVASLHFLVRTLVQLAGRRTVYANFLIHTVAPERSYPAADQREKPAAMTSTLDASPTTLRVGTRGSKLALFQTERVIDALQAAHPHLTYDPIVISTRGDRDKQSSLAEIGGQGVFAKDLQLAILNGEIDCAVHSVKDLTSVPPDGLILAAVLDRSDPRDVLISRYPGGLDGLPSGARVGTSSRRRIIQLRLARPDLQPVDLRGNVDTRLAKVLDDPEGAYDAAILAAAGVLRMGWESRIGEYLDIERFTPAPGQAALGVDCRRTDAPTRQLLTAINDQHAMAEVEAERSFLRTLGGGCAAPVAAHARIEGDIIRMWAMYADESMERVATAEDEADIEDGNALGERLAQLLRERVEE